MPADHLVHRVSKLSLPLWQVARQATQRVPLPPVVTQNDSWYVVDMSPLGTQAHHIAGILLHRCFIRIVPLRDRLDLLSVYRFYLQPECFARSLHRRRGEAASLRPYVPPPNPPYAADS